MDINLENRKQQVDNLQQFITFSKNKIHSMLDRLGWEPDKVLVDNSLITCPLDTGHKISQKGAELHIKKCALRKEGYNLNEQFLSEPINDPKSSVLIDDYKKIEILSDYRKNNKDYKPGWNGQDPDPKTVDRLTSTFNTQERQAFYDYAVTATSGPPHVPDFDIIHPKRDANKPITYNEQLALERDAKRRRMKYKAIHTSHKSHKEVMREVIEGQMELYKDWLNFNDDVSKDCERERSESKNSAHSDNCKKEKLVCKTTSNYEKSHHSDKGQSHSTRSNGDRESHRSSSKRERSPIGRARNERRRSKDRRKNRSRDRSYRN